ncbi:MAG: serine hydrolase [Patescibacteria group bacterium]|nr:MAG: serine hydrolase [Patescibacteria group bacterium]
MVETAKKGRGFNKDTDFLLIFLPILAAVTFFILVLSDKFNIKLFEKNFVKEVVYQRNIENTEKGARPVIKDEIGYTNAEIKFEELTKKLTIEPGFYGLYIKDIGSGMELKYNEKSEFYTASLYKVPIAAAVLKEVEKGKLSLDDTATYLPYDYAAGTGVIGGYSHGIQLKIREILTELLKNSDNTAQNILLRTLSYKNIQDTFDTVVPDKDTSTFYRYNLSTPYEIGKVIEELYFGKYLNSQHKQYLFDLMTDTSFEDRISPYLEENLIFSHKIGNWPESWHDCGVVKSTVTESELIVCLMSQKAPYENFLNAAKVTAEFINTIMD